MLALPAMWSEAEHEPEGQLYEPPPERTSCRCDALAGWNTLRNEFGIVRADAQGEAWQLHPGHDVDAMLSVYSNLSGTLLLRHQWYSSGIESRFVHADGGTSHAHAPARDARERSTKFHGTTLQAVAAMMRSGGFIPGPNGHGRKGKYMQGLFCADELAEAFLRVDPNKLLVDGALHFAACPAVVELEAAELRRYHLHRRDVHVVPGAPGEVMPGILITKVHVNRRHVWNFCQAHVSRLTPKETCGGGSPSWTTCGRRIPKEQQEILYKKKFHGGIGYKSSRGYVYCPCCWQCVTQDGPRVLGERPLW